MSDLVLVRCGDKCRCRLLVIRRTPGGVVADYSTDHTPETNATMNKFAKALGTTPWGARWRTVALSKVESWTEVEAAGKCGIWIFDPKVIADPLTAALRDHRTRTVRLALETRTIPY